MVPFEAMRERDTVETSLSTVIVVVGGPEELIRAAQRTATDIPGARIETCDLRNVATTVAKFWPFAIVMSEDMYAFDPQEFEALARDVAALLYKTKTDGQTARTLEDSMRPALLQAVYERFE
ncbi:MAG: hypothetical protein OXU20_05725 [Myxococcales bacterium]|nr:hypothetical protein [Myxococcales bacterium]MDD9964795.1 hypothetical protein [Myxococcales bacterium]